MGNVSVAKRKVASLISQLKEKKRKIHPGMFPIQQTPLEGTAKQPLVQAEDDFTATERHSRSRWRSDTC